MDALTSLRAALADRYRIEREIGRGGMATVYLAEDVRHERSVALKVLDPELGARLGAERFLAEIRTTARLQHPNIMPLHDSGEVNGILFYVMPFVEGETLRQRLVREPRLPIDDAVRIARQVADALADAHALGIIHRDIKPENVLLKSGNVLVADFGIAFAVRTAAGQRMTQTGLAMGTPQYMSPEQANGDRDLDARSDVHALGSVLYEMLAGEPPFAGSNAQVVLTRLLTSRARPVSSARADVPPALEQIVAKCLEPKAENRYDSGRELADALATIPTGSHHRGVTSALIPRLSRRAVAGAAGVVLVLAAVGAWRVFKPPAPTAASLIAVMPFTPASPDTELTRIGLDLASTISASLDGLGDVRTVDRLAVLAQAGQGRRVVTLADAAALARRFGARRMLAGSLVRVSGRMRLDAALYDSHDLRVIARAQAEAAPSAIDVITDSVSHALLTQIWGFGSAPSPSVDVALKTRSLPALQSFLEGERLITEDHWDEAVERYRHAFALDSTFWLAASRLRYAQTWAGGQGDTATFRRLTEHRSALPERERLLDESTRTDSFSVVRSKLEQLTKRYPDSWLGWFAYGDFLLHFGPLLGGDAGDAAPAFNRALQLNPGLVPAWDHLLMVVAAERDSAGMRRVVDALSHLPSVSGAAQFWCQGRCDYLLQARYLGALVQTNGRASASLSDSVDRDVARSSLAVNIAPVWYGFSAVQIERLRARLRAGVVPPARENIAINIAIAWASRGAWDSALVAAHDRGDAANQRLPVRAYELAVLGFWAGAIDSSAVLAARPSAAQAAQSALPREAARFHWADALAAFVRGDQPALATARTALIETKARFAPELDSELELFSAKLAKRPGRWGHALAALELARTERGGRSATQPPLAEGVTHITAARWLIEEGDTAQAARTLVWHEADGTGSEKTVLEALTYLEQARLDDARGRVVSARRYYSLFLNWYDAPVPAHVHLVDEAKRALARLADNADTKRR